METSRITNMDKNKLSKFFKEQGMLIALILVIAIFSITSDTFLTFNNIMLVMRQMSIIGIIACGMTFVIIGGNFDLSVGSLVSLCTVVVISLHDTLGPVPAILIGLLVGVLAGVLNGYLVGYLKLNSMIITLGMMGVLQAITLIYTGGKYSVIADPDGTWFKIFGRGFVFGGIPFPVIIYIILTIIFAIFLTKTVYGRQLLAVGGNNVASKFAGINDSKVVMTTFILTGLTSGIASIVMGSRIMSAQNYIGQGYEFEVITGVILGGTSLLGGEGSVIKTFMGIMVLGFLQNGFILIGFPYYTQWVVQCIIIIAVVWIDVASKRGGKILA